MFQYALSRLISFIPTLVVVTVIIFTLVRLLPGDPASIILGEAASPQAVTELRHQLGLDRSWPQQYLSWMGSLLRFDLGVSYRNLRVVDLLKEKLPTTLELALLAMLVSILIALPAGIVSALRPNSLLDRVITFLALSGISVPTFFTGIVLIFVFSVNLAWIPASGYVALWENPAKNLQLMILPAFTLGSFSAAVLTRFLRAGLHDVMTQDYIRTAKAKGLSFSGVVWQHAIRNALIPAVTVLGLQLGGLLGGAVITEQIFSIPGIGNMLITAVLSRDIYVVQAAVVCSAVLVFVVSFLVDLAYAWIDPRIRYQ